MEIASYLYVPVEADDVLSPQLFYGWDFYGDLEYEKFFTAIYFIFFKFCRNNKYFEL